MSEIFELQPSFKSNWLPLAWHSICISIAEKFFGPKHEFGDSVFKKILVFSLIALLSLACGKDKKSGTAAAPTPKPPSRPPPEVVDPDKLVGRPVVFVGNLEQGLSPSR